jgi:hypothetical protein
MSSKIICNKCGKELDMWDMQEGFRMYRRFGYGTKYDGDTVDLNLCCDCIEKLIDSCLVSPIITENGSDEHKDEN